jgi:hypothetical protein
MKTRVILFSRKSDEDSASGPQFLFARWGNSLLKDLPAGMGVEDYAQQRRLKRHSTFDHTVGDRGRNATLLECVESPGLELDGVALVWDSFRATAQALSDGQDRRFLQLAVQFLAAGGNVDDSVIAADYDAEFLQELQRTLAAQSKTKEN